MTTDLVINIYNSLWNARNNESFLNHEMMNIIITITITTIAVTITTIMKTIKTTTIIEFTSISQANTLDNEILVTIDNGMIDNDMFKSLMHDISITKYLALISNYLSTSRNDNRNLTTNYKSLGVPL